jgi:hypothetical protein
MPLLSIAAADALLLSPGQAANSMEDFPTNNAATTPQLPNTLIPSA